MEMQDIISQKDTHVRISYIDDKAYRSKRQESPEGPHLVTLHMEVM